MTARLIVALTTLVLAGVAPVLADDGPEISVREGGGGTYVVSARFTVAEPAVVVRMVLTDYERIPRFMPGVQASRVLARYAGYARVEQEAVSRFMLFSKRVYLLLDVTEDAGSIRFTERSGKSFTRYDGAWTIADGPGQTAIEYSLTAAPAFDVPGFVLRKLLDRDARVMIERLRGEMRQRAAE